MPISPLLRGTLAGSPGATTPQQVIQPGQVAPLPGTNLTSMGPAPAGAISGSPAPAAPAAPDYNQLAKEQVAGNMAAGTEWAQSVLPDGSLTRLSDPRAAEMNALLAQLKERTGGMTQQEMLAQQENGIASTDQLLAQNMRRAGDIGAASGVRGGAVAGLKMDALRDSTQARAAFQRQLILDNIAQKNQAFAAYGNTLVNQQGTELGIGKYNAGKDDAEKVGRIDLANQYGGMLDSTASSLKAEDRAKEATDISKSFGDKVIEILEKQGGGSGGPTDPTKPVETRDTKAIYGSITSELKNSLSNPAFPNRDASGRPVVDVATSSGPEIDSIKTKVKEFVDLSYPDLTEAERKDKYNETFRQAMKDAGAVLTNDTANAFKIICTEARRQGFLTSDELATSHRFGMKFMSQREFHAYWTWAQPVVKLMRASNTFAWAISKLLHPLIRAEDDKLKGTFYNSTLLGHTILRVFRATNKLVMSQQKPQEDAV